MDFPDISFFINRRTIRRYRPEPLPEGLLEQLLEAAAHAPSTGNMQLYSVVVTTDPTEKKALAPYHFG